MEPLAASFLDQLLNLMYEAVVVVDDGSRIRMANAAATRLFGYTSDEMIGLPLDRLVPAALRAAHAGLVTDFVCGNAESRPMGQRPRVRAVRSDGSEFSCEISIGAMRRGGDLSAFAVIRDLTDFEAEWEKTARRDRRYRLLFEHAAEGIVEIAEDGTIADANGAARRMFGSDELVLATFAPALEGFLKVAPDTTVAGVVVPPGDRVYRRERTLQRSDGSTIAVAVTVQGSLDVDGMPAGLRVRLVDVTARVSAERRLAESELRLRSVLDESVNSIVIVAATDGTVLYENVAARNLFGSALLDQRLDHAMWNAVTAAADTERVVAAFDRLVAHEEDSVTMRIAIRQPDSGIARRVELSMRILATGSTVPEVLVRAVDLPLAESG